MQQKTKLETVDIEAIKKLAEKYHINLEGQPPYSNHTLNMISKYGVTPIELHLKKFEIFFKRGFNFNQQITHNWFKENLEVAQLIVFLNEAIQNKTDVTFSSTIKGVKKSVSLSSFSALIIEFWSLANVYLNNIQDGTYQNEFKIPSFEKEDYSYGNFKTMPDFFKDDICQKCLFF